MEQKAKTENRALDDQLKDRAEATKVCDDAWKRANQVYKEAKKQADIVCKEAKKIAVDKQAKNEADKAYKETIEQAKKLRDLITGEAMAVFRISYDQATVDFLENTTKSQKAIKDADEAYKEAKQQADVVYEDAKKMAVDKQAKNEADKAYKETIEQAKQVRDEAARKLG